MAANSYACELIFYSNDTITIKENNVGVYKQQKQKKKSPPSCKHYMKINAQSWKEKFLNATFL